MAADAVGELGGFKRKHVIGSRCAGSSYQEPMRPQKLSFILWIYVKTITTRGSSGGLVLSSGDRSADCHLLGNAIPGLLSS
jgi:hypothetical protein